MSTVIEVENLSKAYQLGEIGTGTISRDLERWWAKRRGKEDPLLKIGELNDRAVKGSADIVWSLKNINFEINKGDAIGIIGRNGAGKSTLLKLLSRITSPTTGTIKLKGRIASLLEVGTGFHPELTGRENIFLNGAILGMRKKEIRDKLEEIIEFSGVERFIDTPVKRYSSGMYVRLAFAVAAHLDSDILIVDEVLAVGDAEFQKKCLGKMGEVTKDEGRTILFVSHNMQAINTLCRQVLLFENGGLDFYGPAGDGIKKYLHQNSIDVVNVDIKKQIELLPKDDVFELVDLNIMQEDSNGFELYSNKTIKISVEYKVNHPAMGLRVGFDMSDAETGAIIFRSFHDEHDQEINVMQAGSYFSEASIPANLLNEGLYFLSLSIGIHNVRWIVYESVKTSFRINNVSGINKIYSEKSPGIIKPEIGWITNIKSI